MFRYLKVTLLNRYSVSTTAVMSEKWVHVALTYRSAGKTRDVSLLCTGTYNICCYPI